VKGSNNLSLLVQPLLEIDIFIRVASIERGKKISFNENYDPLGKKRLLGTNWRS